LLDPLCIHKTVSIQALWQATWYTLHTGSRLGTLFWSEKVR